MDETPALVHYINLVQCTMDGDMALWYSRSRLTSSDFDRNRRAQEVVKAIFTKAMNLNMLPKIPELYGLYRE